MRLVYNKYVPDFVWVDGQLIHWYKLDSPRRLKCLNHCKHISSVANRPWYKRLIADTEISIMNYGGGFMGDQWNDMCKLAHSHGYQIQWLISDAHGGGRGATGWGFVFFAKENLAQKYLEELGLWEAYSKLPKAKQISRLAKFFGVHKIFEEHLKIKITKPYPFEGIVFGSQNFMAKHNIPFGAKTTGPTKGLMAYSTVETGYDIIIPENENKLNLTEEQLSKSFWINPSITPSQMFSKNLVNKFTERIGRNPTEGHDL